MRYNGFLVVNKPMGYTSHQVVAEARRILTQRRVGHTGTLDPIATGVLALSVGKATKLLPYLDEEKKVYRTRLLLGIRTDTQDITGQVLSSHQETKVSREEINAALEKFTGEQFQVPPMYSAVKVAGEPLYKLARQGKEIARKARRITIFRLEFYSNPLPIYEFGEGPELLVESSKGTYIRSLCHEIGDYLGCGGCMGELTRLASGPFLLENALTLEEISKAAQEGSLLRKIIPPERALGHLPMIQLTKEEAERVLHGNRIPAEKAPIGSSTALAGGMTFDQGLIAILKQEILGGEYFWRPVRVLV